MKLIALCLLFIAASSQTVFDPGCTPFGLRLSYGQYYTQQGGSTQIYVSFNTYGYCPNSYVGFGNLAVYTNFSCTTNFVNFTWEAAPYFNNTIYTCPISGIDFNNAVLYTAVGVDSSNNSQAWMGKNVTTVLQDKSTGNSLQFLVLGDWSWWNQYNNATQYPYSPITNCLDILASYTVDDFQGIIFTGDQAYNLDSNNGTNYVQFLTMLERYSSVWPFMATLGNRDSNYTNASYIYNLTYPYPYQYPNQFYYNFVLGDVTFISYDPTQVLFNNSEGPTQLQQLISNINQTLNASTTKFNIPFSHYPFLCTSTTTNPPCSFTNQTLYPIQQLFYSYNVQLSLAGHVHDYQRNYPVNLQGQVSTNALRQFNNLSEPIYIIEGAAGSTDYIQSPIPLEYFTAEASFTTGFGILNISSVGVIYKHYVAANCSLADEFMLTYLGVVIESGGFPVWLIVLLSVLGGTIVGVLIWYFCYHRKKRQVQQAASAGGYQQFEVGSINPIT